MMEPMDVIYVDELFALNALIDYLLLLLAGRLRGIPLRRGRTALAAALGGLYAVAAAIPALAWADRGGCRLGMSLLMAWVVWGDSAGLWKSWLAFLAVSALFGGAVFAVSALAGERAVPGTAFSVPFRVLLVSFGGCYALVRLCLGELARRRQTVLPAEIGLAGRKAVLSVLRDTGNQLTDPLSGAEILVADPEALSPLFSPPLPRPLPEDPAELFRLLSGREDLAGRVRLVPFSSLGKNRGLLVCFRPDSLRIAGEDREALAAFSPVSLGGADYTAIY